MDKRCMVTVSLPCGVFSLICCCFSYIVILRFVICWWLPARIMLIKISCPSGVFKGRHGSLSPLAILKKFALHVITSLVYLWATLNLWWHIPSVNLKSNVFWRQDALAYLPLGHLNHATLFWPAKKTRIKQKNVTLEKLPQLFCIFLCYIHKKTTQLML